MSQPLVSALAALVPPADSDTESLVPDGGLEKTILVEGEGEPAGKGARVSLRYSMRLADTPNAEPFDSSASRRGGLLQFTVGSRKVIPAMDLIAESMAMGEECEVVCAPLYTFGSRGLKKKGVPGNSTIMIRAEMVKLEGGTVKKPFKEMNSLERFSEAVESKEKGNKLFKETKFEKAIAEYSKAIRILAKVLEDEPALPAKTEPVPPPPESTGEEMAMNSSAEPGTESGEQGTLSETEVAHSTEEPLGKEEIIVDEAITSPIANEIVQSIEEPLGKEEIIVDEAMASPIVQSIEEPLDNGGAESTIDATTVPPSENGMSHVAEEPLDNGEDESTMDATIAPASEVIIAAEKTAEAGAITVTVNEEKAADDATSAVDEPSSTADSPLRPALVEPSSVEVCTNDEEGFQAWNNTPNEISTDANGFTTSETRELPTDDAHHSDEHAAIMPTESDVREMHVKTLNNLALCCIKIKQFGGAEQASTIALKMDASNSKAFYNRGRARAEIGRLEEARADFRAAAKIQPNNMGIRTGLLNVEKKLTQQAAKERRQAQAMFA